MSRFLQTVGRLRGLLLLNLIIFVGICLLFGGCEIKGFARPLWEVPLRVPLINGEYPIMDLYWGKNNENIGVDDPDNPTVMFFYTEDQIKGADIGTNELKITENPIGVGPLPVIASFSGELSLTDGDDDDVSIVNGIINSGTLIFRFASIPDNVTVIGVTIREVFLDESPVSFFIQRQNQNFEYPYNLANHMIRQPDSSQSIVDKLNFDMTITSTSAITNPGTMTILYREPISFREITGFLNNFYIDPEPGSTNIDLEYPQNIEDALTLRSPILTFEIWNHLGFETVFTGVVTATNTKTGAVESLNLESIPVSRRTVLAKTADVDSLLTTLTFSEANGDDIAKLLNIVPDLVEVTDARFWINNPDTGFGFAQIGKAFGGTYRTEVPFNFDINPGVRVSPAELTEVSISEENRKEIKKWVEDVYLRLTMSNYFSVGAQLRVYFCSSDDPEQVYVEENVIGENFQRLVFLETYEDARPLKLPATTYDAPVQETFTFKIAEEDLNIFYDHEKIYVGIEIEFDGQENAIIHPLEGIDILGNILFNILVEL